MYKVELSAEFRQWFERLPNSIAKHKIQMRIDRAERGNFGNHKRLNEFLWEMKDIAPSGFRIYYTFVGDTICFIISGGFKESQSKDIKYATQVATQIAEERKNEWH